jgi:hypothetical protein
VRVVRTSPDTVAFQLGKREKELLLELLKLYPRIPDAYQRLSKTTPLEESSQKLLDEALSEQRATTRRQLDALMGDAKRWTRTDSGWRLELSNVQLEWLLQVFNDIRIGSWIALGSPEGQVKTISEETAPHLWAMEMAGAFEEVLLEVLGGKA